MEYNEMISGVLSTEHQLFSLAMRLTNDEDDAKDLVQETTYRILKHSEKFVRGTNFPAWAKTILRNLFINNRRRQARWKNIMTNNSNTKEWLTPKNTGNKALSNLEVSDLEKQIEQLSLRYRQPFMMAYQGYTYDEIAEILGWPIGTVKTRIFHARKKLQAQVQSLARYSSEST